MKPDRFSAAALAALVLTAEAMGENLFLLRAWVDEVVLIDRDSIVRKGARAQAWVIERKERPAGPSNETRSLYAFDCAARTLGVIERHGGAGSAPETALAPPRSAMEQTLLAYACGR